MSKTFKTIMIGIGGFAFILAIFFVVYQVRKPATTPSPTPRATAIASPTTAPVFEVTPTIDACSTSFVVACGSASPSPSSSVTPSPSPSPSAPLEASLDCVSKEVFADDSRNRAGFYYLETKIADASTIQSGTTVTYNIIAKNNGGVLEIL